MAILVIYQDQTDGPIVIDTVQTFEELAAKVKNMYYGDYAIINGEVIKEFDRNIGGLAELRRKINEKK